MCKVLLTESQKQSSSTGPEADMQLRTFVHRKVRSTPAELYKHEHIDVQTNPRRTQGQSC